MNLSPPRFRKRRPVYGRWKQRHERKRETLGAHAKARAQNAVFETKRHPSLEEEVIRHALAAKTGFLPSTLRDSRRLGKRTSTWISRLDLVLAFRVSLHEKRHLTYPFESQNIMALVLGSGEPRKKVVILVAWWSKPTKKKRIQCKNPS